MKSAGRHGAGWLIGVLVAGLAALHAAGLWTVTAAIGAARAAATQQLAIDTEGRARALEAALANARADVAFLARSPAFANFETEIQSGDARVARWRRLAIDGALLLTLRGHPEIGRLGVFDAAGVPRAAAGPRGGVPVLWNPERLVRPAATEPHAAAADGRPELTLVLDLAPGGPSRSAGRLEATLLPDALLNRSRSGDGGPVCVVHDGSGAVLAADGRPAAPASGLPAGVTATLRVPGWHVGRAGSTDEAGTWTLVCSPSASAVTSVIDPLAGRLRALLTAHLVLVALGGALGFVALRQTLARRALEQRRRDEARLADLERQLYHADRLGRMGQLAAGLAHEINNPLEGMSNYLRLAEQALAAGDTGTARSRLEQVGVGLSRAAAVLRRVLSQAEPAPEPDTVFDLAEVARRSLDFVRAEPRFARLDLRGSPAAAPLAARGSPVLIGQVLLNLLVNAGEAQPGGGEVVLQDGRVDGGVFVEVQDRGPGIRSDDAERIFEPFWSTKGSTGLGLAICRSIVAGHGGRLEVRERPGGGAVFHLWLPAAPADATLGAHE